MTACSIFVPAEGQRSAMVDYFQDQGPNCLVLWDVEATVIRKELSANSTDEDIQEIAEEWVEEKTFADYGFDTVYEVFSGETLLGWEVEYG